MNLILFLSFLLSLLLLLFLDIFFSIVWAENKFEKLLFIHECSCFFSDSDEFSFGKTKMLANTILYGSYRVERNSNSGSNKNCMWMRYAKHIYFFFGAHGDSAIERRHRQQRMKIKCEWFLVHKLLYLCVCGRSVHGLVVIMKIQWGFRCVLLLRTMTTIDNNVCVRRHGDTASATAMFPEY